MKITIGPGCFIKQRGKTWSVVFSDSEKGQRQKWKSLKTQDQAVATAKAYEMMRQREMGRYDPWNEGQSDATLPQALRHYLRTKPARSAIDCARMLERVCEYGRITSLAAITPERIIDFIYQPGISDASRWSYHNKIAAVVNWLYAKGYFTTNPIDDVEKPPEPKTIPKHFQENELELFLSGCETFHEKNKGFIHTHESYPLWYIPAFELIAFSGLRKTEAARLDWEAIHFPKHADDIGIIYVMQKLGRTKSRIDRAITMHPRAERVLRWCEANWRQTNDGNEPVLKNHTGTEGISGDYLSRKFAKVRAHVFPTKRMDLHGLRHTYAALLRRRGVPIADIKEELGHQDVKTTMKYGKLTLDERMKSTFSRL